MVSFIELICFGVKMFLSRWQVREHFWELGSVANLENEDGRTWRLLFEKPQIDLEWLQGWDCIVVDNDPKVGDIIVFIFIATSCFCFIIFEEDGNIINKTTSTLNDVEANKEMR